MKSPAKPPPLPGSARATPLRNLLVGPLLGLLILTAVILIWASTGFGAGMVAIKKARKAQAKHDCVNLVQAVAAYFADYGRLPPIPGAGGGRGALTDNAAMDILLGFNIAANPRALRYFSGKAAVGRTAATAHGGLFFSIAGGAELLDPWKKKPGGVRHFYLLLDLDGDGKIPDPTDPGFTILGRSAVAWSTGPDGRAHPDPDHPDNRDNVYSWK
ncbi:MAG: hypothetical protein HKN82_05035 [Akkermansiaceae bacterium]|nr:hypothetical protein [Akkermansiaceae bacterium]